MSEELDEKIKQLQELIDIQCVPGTIDYDPYMQGMANGMLLAMSILEDYDGEPGFIEAPDMWLRDKEILKKLSNSGVKIK